jgi:hypothetical protein
LGVVGRENDGRCIGIVDEWEECDRIGTSSGPCASAILIIERLLLGIKGNVHFHVDGRGKHVRQTEDKTAIRMVLEAVSDTR